MTDPYCVSKVKISRNLADYFFVPRLGEQEAVNLGKKIAGAADEIGLEGEFKPLRVMTNIEQKLYEEEGLLDNKMQKNWKISSLYAGKDLSMTVNGEDHLTIETRAEGLGIRKAFKKAYETEERFDKILRFAFDPKYGYLLADPRNAGTGLKLSCIIHLKAFTMTGVLPTFRDSMLRIGFDVEPVFGQQALDLYEISYRRGYGESEEESLEKFENILDRGFKNERDLRREQYEKNPVKSKDMYYRALGLIRYGRIIKEHEIFEVISNLLYGYSLGFRDFTLNQIVGMIPIAQKYHLLEYKRRLHSTSPVEIVRGDRIREYLKEAQHGE